MPAINFPPNPTRLNYTATAWVDPYGSPWIWNQSKLRWSVYVVLPEKQPLDADLTAYANAADSAARRALIEAGTSSMPAYLALTSVPVFGAASTPVITAIGQGAVVTHSDGSQTEWGAVSMTLWKPRTAGILLHYSNKFYQASLAADGTAEYTILLNQPPANL